ncbi:MAG: YceI family protein [Bacteroidales bacterium]|nr:YceI family protein [Bacteroidales bacterium]
MKILNILFVITIASFAFSCSNSPEGQKTDASEAKAVDMEATAGVEFTVNTASSQIEWLGTKPTGQHTGTIMLQSGSLTVIDGELKGGQFIVDMNSIINHDLEEEEWNTKLVNHLKSDDFFSVEKFPTARFEITSVEKFEGIEEPKKEPEGEEAPTHLITGNLTMKGITKSITFGAVVKSESGAISAYTPQFKIDRSEWDVRYQSKKFFDDLKDKFIHDDIALTIKLIANQ